MLATVLRGELAEQAGVEVILFTENGHGKRGFLTTAVVNEFIQDLQNRHIIVVHPVRMQEKSYVP